MRKLPIEASFFKSITVAGSRGSRTVLDGAKSLLTCLGTCGALRLIFLLILKNIVKIQINRIQPGFN